MNEETTLSSNLERIKDAVDDIREVTGETGTIEEVVDAVEALSDGVYNTYKRETFTEMQEIENPHNGDICYVSKRSLIPICGYNDLYDKYAESFNKIIFPYQVTLSRAVNTNFGFNYLFTSTVLEDTDLVDEENSYIEGDVSESSGNPVWVIEFKLTLKKSALPGYSGSTDKATYYTTYFSADGQTFTRSNSCLSQNPDNYDNAIPFVEDFSHKDLEITFPCTLHIDRHASGDGDWAMAEIFKTYDYAALQLGEYSANIVLRRRLPELWNHTATTLSCLDVCVNNDTRAFGVAHGQLVWPYSIEIDGGSGGDGFIELDMDLPVMDIMNKPYITSPKFFYPVKSSGDYEMQSFTAGSKYIANPIYPSTNPSNNGLTEISYTNNALPQYSFDEVYLNLPYAICLKEPLEESQREPYPLLVNVICTQFDGTVYTYKYNGTKNEWEFINAEY